VSLCRVLKWRCSSRQGRGRTDPNTIAGPGREPDEGDSAVIARKLSTDPHISAWRPTRSLGIVTSRSCRCLTEVAQMKCRYLHCVTHTLTLARKQRVLNQWNMDRTLTICIEPSFHLCNHSIIIQGKLREERKNQNSLQNIGWRYLPRPISHELIYDLFSSM
jgi:hypothetical protein